MISLYFQMKKCYMPSKKGKCMMGREMNGSFFALLCCLNFVPCAFVVIKSHQNGGGRKL